LPVAQDRGNAKEPADEAGPGQGEHRGLSESLMGSMYTITTPNAEPAMKVGADVGGEARVEGSERETYYSALWNNVRMGQDEVPGRQAAQFLLASGLQPTQLKKIWTLADQPTTGSLDRDGFFLALNLVAQAQAGVAVDNMKAGVLPASLPIFQGYSCPSGKEIMSGEDEDTSDDSEDSDEEDGVAAVVLSQDARDYYDTLWDSYQ